MEPGNLGSALLFGALPALLLLALVYWLDRYEKEPATLLAFAIVFGAVLAPAIAVGIQSLLDVPTSIAVQSTVSFSRLNATTPIVEEIVKAVAILIVFSLVHREIDGPLDGLVYGGAVGIGFGLTATFLAILQTPSIGIESSASLFAATVAGVNHLFYAGLVGFALGLARKQGTGGLLGAWVVGTAAAVGAHLLHDYLPEWLAAASFGGSGGGIGAFLDDVPNALGLVTLAVLFAWAAARESRVVAEELGDEVRSGVVTAEDYTTITDPWKRFSVLTNSLFSEKSWKHRRKLYSLEVELAFRKRRGGTGDRLRERIRVARDTLLAEEAGS